MSRGRRFGASFQKHRHIDGHTEVITGRSDKTAGNRGLVDIAGDGNAYQIAAVDRPIRSPAFQSVM
jgi:hypothetical protein